MPKDLADREIPEISQMILRKYDFFIALIIG
jgi:hypothetical protein